MNNHVRTNKWFMYNEDICSLLSIHKFVNVQELAECILNESLG